ncbi:uncharacterized protein C12orf56-like isoform X2 [Amphibalanus amphitrite]|uniref:uncharacterized protein C12orf56-like isoform X2 n=1 Tax=Amphibalanus amphitrite TaxID=1232801 RepID=UPI001C928617|nr:uncharacterized protein C12orf56-like isoform X2 [Amphibalanus amphitrite]
MDGHGDGQKKNSRLESFLLRKMTPACYESIRYYEPCILRRGKTVQNMQTAVVTEAALFCVEQPPKSLQQLVKLPDIVSIERVHDVVEFLREPLRSKVQHVRIEYRPSPGPGAAGPPPMVRRRSGDGASERRRTLSRLEEEVEELGGRLGLAGRTTPGERHTPDSGTRRCHTPGSPVREGSSLLELLERRHAAGSPEPPGRRRCGSPDSRGGPARLCPPGPATPSRGLPRSQSALPAYNRSSSMRVELPERSRSVLDRPLAERKSKKRSTSLDDVRGPATLPPPEVYHIYLLQGTSLFQRHLKTAWMARLISGTQALEQPSPEPAVEVDHRQLDQLFDDLRISLLTSGDPEHKAGLVHELKIGASQYKRVRRLFWKDVRLFDMLTSELTSYLLSTSSFDLLDDGDEEQGLRDREEELDHVVLLMETLGALLRDVEAMPQAAKTLLQEKSARLAGLLRALLTRPWVPGRYLSTAKYMLSDFREFVAASWDNLPEAELIKLLAEVTNTCTGTLYELLQVLQHVDPSGAALRQSLSAINLEHHLSAAVTQLLAFLYPARASTWSPGEAVLVYQHLIVLQTLTSSLPTTLAFIQRQFTEEFRYYVNPVVVGHKLPARYPIRHQLLHVMETLAKKIGVPGPAAGAIRHRGPFQS